MMATALRPTSTISSVQLLRMLVGLKDMDAKTFCDRWFGIDKLEPRQKEETWSQRGHRAKCVRVLSKVLVLEEKTVGNWGAKFERMPKDHQPTLKYADVVRRQIQAVSDSDLLELVLETLSNQN